MAGTIEISDTQKWTVRSGIFYWTMTELAKEVESSELKSQLLEIDQYNIGFLNYSDLDADMKKQIRDAASALVIKSESLPAADQGDQNVVKLQLLELLSLLD